jgi:diguanylate cyclase (GGDEF)-like protein
MLLDQLSLLTAIAFSSAALTITMFIGWMSSRQDRYLLSWALGLVVVVAGVIAFGWPVAAYDPALHLASFVLTLAGFTLIYVGALQFRGHVLPVRMIIGLLVLLVSVTVGSFIAGYSGVGTVVANSGMALLLSMAAVEYWRGRHEAAAAMTANAILYGVAAASFWLCAIVLAVQGSWVLHALPDNWAEDLNSIVIIFGLTGIGAISLTLNQTRAARHHLRQSLTDPLTGLLNRRALFETYSATPLRPGVAVIMFDLDHFKTVNDRFGHAGGDVLLEAFARVLRENLRVSDTAARLGGEEFCVVLTDLSRRSATGVAERIRAAFEQTAVPTARGTAETTMSAGVAIAAVDGEAFETVLRRADDALYAAKEAGRNRVQGPGPRLVA